MPQPIPAQGPADWTRLSVVVVGVGLSGEAVAMTLRRRGVAVLAVDDGVGERQQAAATRLRAAGAMVELGGLPTELPAGVDLVVTSPGLRPTTPLFESASHAGVPVWGEVELAFRLRPTDQRWLAVTGTNGKTTTTQMLGAVLAASGLRSATAGNIGTPLLDAVTSTTEVDGVEQPAYEVLAVELSSFQLHYTSTLAVTAGAVLNVAADHLDWHGSVEAYAADKGKIFGRGTVAVYNADDRWAPSLAAGSEHRVGFTLGVPGPGSLGVLEGELVDRGFGGGPLLAVEQLQVPGPHNIANALAAAALARAVGVDVAAVRAGLAGFRAGEHRNALVASVDGVGFVNDSKATNPHAAAASLTAYDSVVWIAGGLNKGLDFDELVRDAAPRLRAAVLIGTCADEVADALARHAPEVPVVRAESMDDAVVEAKALARRGDTVLLAPAAASMDMFDDYAARGDAFAVAAQRLQGVL